MHLVTQMLVVLLLLCNQATATCYAPNGSIQVADYKTCYSSDASFCCSSSHDDCLPSGLCQWNNGEVNTYWREGCSDPLWPPYWCLANVCDKNVDQNGNAQLTPCDGTGTSTTWCCGANNTKCCGNKSQEIYINATIAGLAQTALSTDVGSPISVSIFNTSTTSTSTTSTSNAMSTISPSIASSSTSRIPAETGTRNPNRLSSGAKAGIGVGGAAAGLGLLTALVVLVMMLRRRRQSVTVSPHYAPDESKQTAPHELPTTEGRAELEGDSGGTEVEGDRGGAELEGDHGESELEGNAGAQEAKVAEQRSSERIHVG